MTFSESGSGDIDVLSELAPLRGAGNVAELACWSAPLDSSTCSSRSLISLGGMTLESVCFRLPPKGLTIGDWRTRFDALDGRDGIVFFLVLRAESAWWIADSPNISTS